MRKKVMVCDDDLYVIELLCRIAREEGFDAISAEDGKEGLRLAREQLPDVLFLDMMMDGKDGLEVWASRPMPKAAIAPALINTIRSHFRRGSFARNYTSCWIRIHEARN